MADWHYIEYRDIKIPLKVKQEWRRSVRYSISKKSINLTVPKFYSKEQLVQEYRNIREWSYRQFKRTPNMVERFKPRQYFTGDRFKIYGDEYILEIRKENRKTFSAEISGNQVVIKAPEGMAVFDQHSNTGALLSRLFSKHYLPAIRERVLKINARHFNEEIKNVSLKNNQSNWGSCSSNRNINLSSRLLFAPSDILDYVIVHELAHLKEMNHSKKFWSIVERAMPDYKPKDAWLTKNGYLLKF